MCDLCRSVENSFVEVESLTPYTSYKFLLIQCGGSKAHYNEFNIQTNHDSKLIDNTVIYRKGKHSLISISQMFFCVAPGPVTNHKIYKKDGIVIEWSEPTNPNGILKNYLVEWSIANHTFSENLPYQSEIDRNVFKVSERIQVTV